MRAPGTHPGPFRAAARWSLDQRRDRSRTLPNVPEPIVIEDDRGVDIAQIRAQLRLTVPERVKSMVDAANALITVQDAANTDRSARVH